MNNLKFLVSIMNLLLVLILLLLDVKTWIILLYLFGTFMGLLFALASRRDSDDN